MIYSQTKTLLKNDFNSVKSVYGSHLELILLCNGIRSTSKVDDLLACKYVCESISSAKCLA